MATRRAMTPRGGLNRGSRRWGLVLGAVAALGLAIRLASADPPPDEHSGHHPAAPPIAPGGSTATPEREGEMGGSMHGRAPSPLYPALMNLPDLGLERRGQIQVAAQERMRGGISMLLEGVDRLAAATAADDPRAMSESTVLMRGGLEQYETGLAALRALSEGRAPRDVALAWFRREMNLADPRELEQVSGLFGLSSFHFLSMVALVVFAAAMVAMYFFKMRRAGRLLEQLTASPTTTPGPAAAVAVPPRPSTVLTGLPPPAVALTAPPAAIGTATPAPIPAEKTAASVPTEKWSGVLRVVGVFRETGEIRTLRLAASGSGEIPFRFAPGQFLTMTVTRDGKPVRRAYSISSSPAQRAYCEITVKRESRGAMSPYLCDEVKAGDLLACAAPGGSFTFTGAEAPGVVLIGGGVGLTPLMSVIRYLTDVGWPGPVHLLFFCRTTEDFLFREELERLQRRHANLEVIASMTRAQGTTWMGPCGRPSKSMIAAAVPDIASRRVHLCGPPPMMDAVKGILNELGVPPMQVKTEIFGPPAKPSSGPAMTDAAAVAVAPRATAAIVQFARSKVSAAVPAGRTILDAADSIGVFIDNACRSGTCGSCKVKLQAGVVSMAVEDALEPAEKASGIVLACQALPSGDVTVDA